MDDLLQKIIDAARSAEAEQAVRVVLQDFVRDPEQAAARCPDFENNDVILFEDETVSVWFWRFLPGQRYCRIITLCQPIGVIGGLSEMMRSLAKHGNLEQAEQTEVRAGGVIQLPAEAIQR